MLEAGLTYHRLNVGEGFEPKDILNDSFQSFKHKKVTLIWVLPKIGVPPNHPF